MTRLFNNAAIVLIIVFSLVVALTLSNASDTPVVHAKPVSAGNWLHQFGTNVTDNAEGVDIDRYGNVYVAGRTEAALPGQTHSGQSDAYVRKYDKSGSEVWTQQFGTNSNDAAADLAVDDSGNVFIVGYTDGTLPSQTSAGVRDAYVRKYDESGREIWTRQFGFGTGNVTSAYSVHVDASGNIYVVGSNASPSVDYDAYVRVYDKSGNVLWTDQFGTPGWDFAKGVSTDRAGNIYVVGVTSDSLADQTHWGSFDAYIRKYDPSGTELWTQQFGTAGYDSAESVCVDKSGNVYLAGSTNSSLPGQTHWGDYDAYVRKYDRSGSELWTRQFGTSLYDWGETVVTESAGNVYVAGATEGALPGQVGLGLMDAYLRKYNSSGRELWTQQFGSDSNDSARSAGMYVAGSICMAGWTAGALPGQTNIGLQDAYVIELDGLSGTLRVLNLPPCPPDLSSNPRKDVVVTNLRPLLSFFSSTGGTGERMYTIQIDKVPTFDSGYLIEYTDIAEETPYVTSKLIEEGDELDDNTQYFWRARAIDSLGHKSSWATSRFFLDTSSDDTVLGLIRTPVVTVETSCGDDVDNIIDIGDAAAETYWEGCPDQQSYFVNFDLGEPKEVCHIWQLCDRSELTGRLEGYVWQYSNNGLDWMNIPETRTSESDAFRRIIEFDATISARYFRLHIEGWHGSVPRIHEIILYSPGVATPPELPDTDYVLIVGNRHDGSTYGNIRQAIEHTTFDVETVTVPYYEVSLDMINHLEARPVAIILSAFGRWYENLPMFEFNGEYELIRESDIPILGICGGHQLIAMAYGYTYARDMGYVAKAWQEEDLDEITPIDIVKEDPIFESMPDPFVAPEWHGWEVLVLSDDMEVLAVSDCIEVMKSAQKIMYGVQFHPEVELPFNEAGALISNFLGIALQAYTSETR